MVSVGERKRPPTRSSRKVNLGRLAKQSPVLDLEALPDPSRELHGVTNELALLSELEIDIILVVLALDVRHIDGDKDVGVEFLETEEGHDQGREVWCRAALLGLSDLGCLGRDECIRRDAGA